MYTHASTTHAHTHTHTHTWTHMHPHMHTHTCTHSRACTHMHTQTHIHTPECCSYLLDIFFYMAIRVERLGYEVPVFDFRVKAVTSMSADIHKYGLGMKVSQTSG